MENYVSHFSSFIFERARILNLATSGHFRLMNYILRSYQWFKLQLFGILSVRFLISDYYQTTVQSLNLWTVESIDWPRNIFTGSTIVIGQKLVVLVKVKSRMCI